MSEYKLPYYVDFSVTPYCNLKCGFCSASAEGNTTKINELSLNDIDRIFNEFDKNEILRVSIEGGEPFLRNDIIEILKMADEHLFSYYVNTNGTLITKELAKNIAKTKVEKLCISVDGPNELIHDASRGVSGSFKKTKDAIKFLISENVPVDGIITLSNINKNYIFETLEFLNSIGVNNVAIMLLATVGNASINMNKYYLSFDEWKDVLINLTKLRKINKLPVNLNIVPTGESKLPWEIYLPLKMANMEDDMKLWVNDSSISTLEYNDYGCTAGKDNFAIDGFGNVYGCSLMISVDKLKAGNILEEPLKKIWNDSPIFKSFRTNNLSLIEGECKDCHLLHRCQAGCRSCAFSLENNINASDIRCPLTKKE